jgi:hypothetical protein
LKELKMKMMKLLSPPKATTSALLVGGGITGGFALGGAALARLNSQTNPSPLGQNFDTVIGAAEGTALAAVVGLGVAIFSPKWRTVGLGMIGTFGTAWAATEVVNLVAPKAAQGLLTGGQNYEVTLVSGKTIIQRVAVGDSVTVLAPSGWSAPTVAVEDPSGFLAPVATSSSSSSATFQATTSGSGNVVSQSSGSETGTVTIDAT